MPRVYGDSIPEPSRLYTSFGGFPISQYAIYKYSQKSISIVLDHVNVCEHGYACKKCCFIYTGPKRLKQHSGKKSESYVLCERLFSTNKKRSLAFISIMKFMSDVIFGEPHGFHNLHRQCNQHTCGNIFHIKITFRTSLYTVLQIMEQCEHGFSCTDCCWNWPRMPVKGNNNNKQFVFIPLVHTRVRRLLTTEILGKHISRNDFIRSSCANDICVNWNHMYLEHKTQNFIRFNAQRAARIQLQSRG
jgi:hypothetical protein